MQASTIFLSGLVFLFGFSRLLKPEPAIAVGLSLTFSAIIAVILSLRFKMRYEELAADLTKDEREDIAIAGRAKR